MAKNVFSGFRSARHRHVESSRARRRVTTWAALGILALLATLLTPLSTASAQPSAPAAPTVTSATHGDKSVTLTWNAGADGGATVTRWEYTYSVGAAGSEVATNVWTPIPGSNRHTDRHTVTGLTNGQSYVFDLRAVNDAGNGAEASSVSGEVTANRTAVPSTVPSAPLNLRGTEDNSQVVLTWTAAAPDATTINRQNGWSPITRYEYQQKTGDGDYSPWSIIINPDPATTPNAALATHTVTGLTNGNTYQFKVRAVNDNGNGAETESAPVTIATTPGRPRSLTAVPGNAQVTLSWVASGDGGSPILSWQFRQALSTETFEPTTPAWVTIPGSNADTTSYTVVSLDNSLQYKFQIRAVNAEGPGSTAESAVVDPGMPPGAPTAVQGAAAENSVTVTWTPPLNEAGNALNDGGSPIIRYEYSQKTGSGDYGEWAAIAASDLFTTTSAEDRTLTATAVEVNATQGTMGFVVRGLTPGTAYQFRVRAVNATGPGEAGSMPGPAYPGTKPPAPANLSARANYDAASGDATITLTWTSGGDGGSPITHWQYLTNTSLADLSTAAGADATEWVNICDNSTGMAPTCGSTTSVTIPRADPDGPTGPAPAPDGTLTYVDRTTPGTPALSQAEHHFVVRAVNARGNGFQSGTDSARFSPTVPSAPPAVFIGATTGTSITLTWRPSVDGGSAITRYEYSLKVGDGSYGAWVADDTPTDNSATYTVPTGTPAGTVHTFRVRAVNVRGNGSHTESPSIIPGAPGSPGASVAADVAAGTAPRLTASPGTTEVTLAMTGATGGVVASGGVTQWEYSYKVGDGDWGGWLFAGQDGEFAPGEINPSLTTGSTIDGLQNGVVHQFRIRARNGPLAGPVLVSNPVTPGVAPPAAQGFTVAGGDRSVTLSWTSGGSGGPAIMKWQYCALTVSTPPVPPATTPTVVSQDCDNDVANAAQWVDIRGGGEVTSHTIGIPPAPRLVNGTTYTYRLRAMNAIGNGALAQAAPATPGRAPTAPARALVDPGDGQVTITVDPPSSNNGSPVVGYQVRKSQDGGPYDAWESLGTTGRSPSALRGAVVSGLTNGSSYTFQVRAVNAYGPGAEVDTASTTPTGAPTANQLSADPGDGQVALSWNPLSSGGSTIVKWQYRQSESGGGYGAWMDIADSGPSTTSHTVTGLSNGVSYAFEVRGVNVNLEMVNAEPITSAAVMPSAVPPAPSVSAERGNGQVDLTWTAGTSGAAGEATYAAPTTGWQVRTNDGAWTDVPDSNADTTSHSVTGLDNGTAYTFEVRAVNSEGGGAAGSAGPVTPATTPSAPDVSAERGDGSVTLSWTAGDDGGSAVTAWHLQVNDGEWMAIDGSDADTASHTVTGLDNGTAYTFGVRAANDVGDGAAGSASATPATTPSAPEVTAIAGDGTVTLTWTAGDDGGSAVTAWHLQVNGGDWNDLSAFGLGPDTRAVPVPTLTNGTTYTFGVRAANDVGNGAAGEATATPATTPAAPTVTASGSLGQIEVSWTAGDDGGSAVTAWHYRMKFGAGDYGDWNEASADTTSVTLSDLDTGTGVLTYTFQVRAVNAIGEGATGTSNDAMPAMASPENGVFYTGVITGPDFCTNFSLGGAHLIAHDSDGDGVADVCSLPYTRREAIARQSAVEALAVQYADAYAALVNAACAMVEGDDDCGGEMLADPPAIPINDGGAFYSGIITGPSFCANRSLGGPATYPHDSDGDGVADVCALPYTRREAVARQIAGDTLAAMSPASFRRELASACRGLTGGDYGDDPAHLANDACA
ncbi:fibronectin type III domain-containing protein [Candidatus Poriferisocius sp.]|uniref:fibronectin type III domain-containing protein n=1 Tax=Candidatus Poriferisocius sp. TaxID=3101276 RepID=UPI003B011F17